MHTHAWPRSPGSSRPSDHGAWHRVGDGIPALTTSLHPGRREPAQVARHLVRWHTLTDRTAGVPTQRLVVIALEDRQHTPRTDVTSHLKPRPAQLGVHVAAISHHIHTSLELTSGRLQQRRMQITPRLTVHSSGIGASQPAGLRLAPCRLARTRHTHRHRQRHHVRVAPRVGSTCSASPRRALQAK